MGACPLSRSVQGPSSVAFLRVEGWGRRALIILSIHKHSGCLLDASLGWEAEVLAHCAVNRVPQMADFLPPASVSRSEEWGWTCNVDAFEILLG